MIDEDEPPPMPRRLHDLRLEPRGVTELAAYIAELRAEIARVEAEVARKQNHRSAADAVFKR